MSLLTDLPSQPCFAFRKLASRWLAPQISVPVLQLFERFRPCHSGSSFSLSCPCYASAASDGRAIISSSLHSRAALRWGCRFAAGCLNLSSSSAGTGSTGMASGTGLIFAAAILYYRGVTTTDSDRRCCPAGGSPCTMMGLAIPLLRMRVTSAARLPPPGISLLRSSCVMSRLWHLHPPIVAHFAYRTRDACLAITVGIFYYNGTLRPSRLCLDSWMHHW